MIPLRYVLCSIWKGCVRTHLIIPITNMFSNALSCSRHTTTISSSHLITRHHHGSTSRQGFNGNGTIHVTGAGCAHAVGWRKCGVSRNGRVEEGWVCRRRPRRTHSTSPVTLDDLPAQSGSTNSTTTRTLPTCKNSQPEIWADVCNVSKCGGMKNIVLSFQVLSSLNLFGKSMWNWLKCILYYYKTLPPLEWKSFVFLLKSLPVVLVHCKKCFVKLHKNLWPLITMDFWINHPKRFEL